MRTMRFLCWLTVPAVLLGSLNMATAEVSEQVRQACTPDAMRLCSEFIPNAAKVKTCMLRKRAQLSETCLSAMRGPPRRRRYYHRVRHVVHVRHYYHHHYRHHE